MQTEPVPEDQLAALRAELAGVEDEFGLEVVSIFPGSDPDVTEVTVLRSLIPSVRAVGEELRNGTLEVVTEFED